MRVKFTNPQMYREGFDGKMIHNEFFKGDKILFGRVKQVVDECMLEVEWINFIGKPVLYRINPNSDYNFGFILNEEGERKYAEKAHAVCEELERLDKIITK